jgi:hypothetical protein
VGDCFQELSRPGWKIASKGLLLFIGIKESDTGLAPPSQWDLVADKQTMQEEQPLQVARCDEANFYLLSTLINR